MEQQGERRYPWLRLSRQRLAALLRRALPDGPDPQVLAAAPLADGRRNTNYRVRLAGREAPTDQVVGRLDHLVQAGDAAVEAATYAAGLVLAGIHAIPFPCAGSLGPALDIATPLDTTGDR